jgi:hypothetical protein
MRRQQSNSAPEGDFASVIQNSSGKQVRIRNISLRPVPMSCRHTTQSCYKCIGSLRLGLNSIQEACPHTTLWGLPACATKNSAHKPKPKLHTHLAHSSLNRLYNSAKHQMASFLWPYVQLLLPSDGPEWFCCQQLCGQQQCTLGRQHQWHSEPRGFHMGTQQMWQLLLGQELRILKRLYERIQNSAGSAMKTQPVFLVTWYQHISN